MVAYMHKQTFDISGSTVSVNNVEDWFDIDDLIALPVQILNRKGYTTESCCSGYVFDILIESSSSLQYDDYPCCSYILFNKEVVLPTLPSGFAIFDNPPNDALLIERYYNHNNHNDTYRLIREVVEAMEQLYKWALNLPNLKSE